MLTAQPSEEKAVERNEVLTMRAMAWQRAKGELNAMLATYWSVVGHRADGVESDQAGAREEIEERVRRFVAEIEANL